MKDRKISEAVVRRLPKYYRQLQELEKRGIERISSGELSAEMGLNASQIRQDFNCFGGFGQQGYGYQVSSLLREIGAILGLTQQYGMVIVGAGNIGKALARYVGFEKEGFIIKGVFDNCSDLFGKTIGNVLIQDIAQLPQLLNTEEISVGIIATPKENAQGVADLLTANGVKAIWNFAPIDVHSDSAFVENIHLSDHLMVLSYRLQNELQDPAQE
jgi:redox-sensing transcriptional repressor